MSYASYQAMPAEGDASNIAPEGPPRATINAQPGVLRVNVDGSSVVQRPNGLNTSAFTSGGAGILATARTPTGGPPMGGIKATDVITLDNGMSLAVGMAEQMGMIARNASGQYVEVQGGVEAASAEKQEEAPVDDAEVFADAQAEAGLAALAGIVAPDLQVAGLQEAITSGEVSPQTIARAASEAGKAPAEVSAQVTSIMESFRAQAVSTVQSWGSDNPEEFFDWAHTHKPRDMKQAMQAHGMERSTKGYEPLYREYVASVAERDPDAVLNADIRGGTTVRRDGKAIIVNVPGRGEMSFRSALKAGFIKVTGA